MKLGLFLLVIATMIVIAPFAYPASVGPSGHTNDFSIQPVAADWATGSRSGSSTDPYTPDTDVNNAVTAGNVNTQVGSSTADPPVQAGSATWSSTGLYIQTRPTGNRATLLMAKFINATGTNATEIALSYSFTIAAGGTVEDSGKGNRAYYSLSGLSGSWTNLPALNTLASANGISLVSTNITLVWTNGGSLYLLWMDDNAGGSTFDAADQIDNFSLRVTAGTPLVFNTALTVPTNNAVFVSGNAVSVSATVAYGTPPYSMEYFTNSAAGNTEFASAGSSAIAPFEVGLGTLPAGIYNVYAVGRDGAVPSATSITITHTFFVVDPLSVTLEAPADGATIDYLTSVTSAATITGGTPPFAVQFYLDNLPSGNALTSPPYEQNFGTLFVGDHTIRAVATDARGWVSNSITHTIHISGPLGVTFVPTNGAVFTFGEQVVLSAGIGGGSGPYTATFYTNDQPAGSISSAPFALDIGILAAGSYTSHVHVVDSTMPTAQEVYSATNLFFVTPNPVYAFINSPSDGQAFLEGAAITLTAFTFISPPLTITNVQFFYEDTLVGSDTNEPYSTVLSNQVHGTRSIYATATDSLGRVAYSQTNHIVVLDNTPAPNDNFVNAIALSGPAASVSSQNLTATKEPGEPNHAAGNSGGGSLWWTWTPSTSGPATIDTFGSTFDTLLGVYVGNAVNQLTVIAQNDDSGSLQSRVQFNATTGTVYRIAVDGYSGSRGIIRLNIRGAGGVELATPTNGMLAVVGDPITVSARILPDFPNPPPARVDFYARGNLFASVTNEPFTATATNLPAGSNSFYAIAFDSQGTQLQSSTVTVFVQAIGVMILSPLPNTMFSTTNPITIQAWTYLREGSITNMDFFVDGVLIGQDSIAPFSFTWSNVVAGSHRLTAVGWSDRGTSHASAAVNIGVMGTLVPYTAVWRYRDNGSNQGTNWARPDFDDSTWSSGPAPLGYGASGGRFPATTNGSGYITYYYRYSFLATNLASLAYLDSRIERDNGAIVYLNGAELYRDFNMPSGPVAYTDYATFASDDGDSAWSFFASIGRLVEGTNVLAVEVHQAASDLADLWFRLNIQFAPIIIQNASPFVSIANPTNNQYYLAPSNITVEADAFDLDGTVALVEFFADGVKFGEATNAPYTAVWNAPPVGPHNLSVMATDDQGATSFAAVPIVVYDAVGTPLAVITSPANGAVMEGPTNLLVTAAAYAISGVTNVQLLANGETFGQDDSAPYSAIWTAPFGTNLLTAIAFDANGASGTSAVVTVTMTIPPTNVIAPRIMTQFPLADASVTNLTSITATFSEYVQNVDASDLLINGLPATGVDAHHSRSNYTFTFPQPAYGQVTITWAAGHGITDYGWPTVLPLDETQPDATWTYTLLDQTPPTILVRTPAPNSTVTNLSQISVTFSEAVTGVDAADLHINGVQALDVTGNGSNYVFRVPTPAPGSVSVTWVAGHNIFDLAATPNAFNHIGPGAAWNFTYDPRTVLVQSNSFWRFVKGTNEPSLPIEAWRQPAFDDSGWSNSPAPFFYGDPYNSAQIPGTLLGDMSTNYSTVYLRTEFTVLNRALITNLWLNAQSDDGFIAWLNGVEIRRYNAPPGEVPYNTFASTAAPEPQNRGAAYILSALPNAVAALVDGRNVLAVQGLNAGPFSSDFGFNAQLYTYPVDLRSVGPRLLPPDPPQGDVLSLTNVTITFTEPVRGVDASDLLVNGIPIAALTATSDTVYSFSFAQPPFGPVLITWQTDHGITDFDDPPRAFDGSAATSILAYHLINPSSPRILMQAPPGGSSLTGLTAIVVTFTEPVSGVDVADLLVSGAPAQSVNTADSTNYTFSFTQPPFGFVTIRWATNHGIVDVEAGNPFDPTRFGGQWNYTLINPAPSVVVNSPTNGAYRLEPATVTLSGTASDYDGFVTEVAFYQNNSLLAVSTNAPYSFVWSNIVRGTYVLTAVATDDSGLTGTSAPVVLNVVTSLPAALVRGPYLQIGTPTSGVVRWRTDVPTDGVVYFCTDPLNLTNFVTQTTVTNEHIVQVTGLQPSTRYFYSIGSAAQRLAGTNGLSSEYWFSTSPPTGQARRTRLWVLGDPGTAGQGAPDRQQSTRDTFYNYAATNGPADLWLMLGDNAYNSGTDSEYQRAVFDLYPATLRNLFLWPTLGNHETDQSFTATDFPYLHIFTLPQNGEAGGVPSGTQKYYSFDYANIHFISLDSMSSGQGANTPMAEWLRADLAAATAHWLIVFFHHPPYTKGNHDSDRERELIDIRQNIIPILEENGVDLVLNGHSHAWERSYLLHGHYGLSSTLTDSMKIDPGDGREDGSGAYRKNDAGQGVVYTVAGNAGQVTGGSLNHPAHFLSLNELGTMIIDIDGNRLDARFLRQDGEMPDHFTLIKADPRPAAPLHLVATPTGAADVRLDWTDVAANELGYSIERSLDGVHFTEYLSTPANTATALDTGLIANVTYFYRVRGTNLAGVSDYSNIASITPGFPTAAPQAPASLGAASDDGVRFYRSQMIVSWQDRSSDEAAFQIERSQDAVLFVPIATVGANITTYVDRGLDSATVYFYRVRAVNAVGQSGPSNLAMDQTHPQSQFVRAGQVVAFHGGVEGAPPVGYQWRFMDNILPGETNEILALPAVDLADAGEYSVLVTDGNGSARLSNPAVLVVVSPPRIVSQPDDYTRGVGMSIDFIVGVEGTAPFTYHWRMNAEPIGPSAPVLSLSDLGLTDQGGYDVLVENAFGSVTSRVASLRMYGQPVVAPVADMFAEVLHSLRFTNVAIDPNVPPLDLRYSLGPGAPTNAYLNPLSGVFSWTPTRAQAPGTNVITITASDATNTFLSGSTSFTVRVNDYTELMLGSLIILANTNGGVPMSLFSSLPLTDVQATLSIWGDYFSDISFEQPGIQSLSATFQRLDLNTAALTFSATGGGTLVGLNPLGVLRLATRPLTNSTMVPLRVTSFSATTAVTPTMVATNSQVVVVGTRALLEAHLTAQGARELTVFARPGAYALQTSTNLDSVWRQRGNVSVSNNLFLLIRPANNPPTNGPGFFRLRQ